MWPTSRAGSRTVCIYTPVTNANIDGRRYTCIDRIQCGRYSALHLGMPKKLPLCGQTVGDRVECHARGSEGLWALTAAVCIVAAVQMAPLRACSSAGSSSRAAVKALSSRTVSSYACSKGHTTLSAHNSRCEQYQELPKSSALRTPCIAECKPMAECAAA